MFGGSESFQNWNVWRDLCISASLVVSVRLEIISGLPEAELSGIGRLPGVFWNVCGDVDRLISSPTHSFELDLLLESQHKENM